MTDLTLVGLSGALRAGSTNRKLMRFAAQRFDPASFAEGDLRLPLYDGDLEDAEGIPEPVERLGALIRGADAVIISGPEYNGGVSGVLKNALDWLSRLKEPVWRGKPVAIMSATAGRSGGARTQYALRLNLTPFRPLVIPGPEVGVAASHDAFDAEGTPTDAATVKLVDELMATLRAEATRLKTG